MSAWKSMVTEPPSEALVMHEKVLVRRQWNREGTVSERRFHYKLLDTIAQRAISKGWTEWMELP